MLHCQKEKGDEIQVLVIRICVIENCFGFRAGQEPVNLGFWISGPPALHLMATGKDCGAMSEEI
jgi:hypothetical protein